jgi:hypothetical protein
VGFPFVFRGEDEEIENSVFSLPKHHRPHPLMPAITADPETLTYREALFSENIERLIKHQIDLTWHIETTDKEIRLYPDHDEDAPPGTEYLAWPSPLEDPGLRQHGLAAWAMPAEEDPTALIRNDNRWTLVKRSESRTRPHIVPVFGASLVSLTEAVDAFRERAL